MIINADDFGLNDHCTAAIAESFRQGLITDSTILANGDAFEEAVKLGKSEFADKVGIHFNLTEGRPLTEKIKQLDAFCNDGLFHGRINRLKPLNREERRAVYDELTAQIRKLKDAGIKINHADSHHHIHTGIFIAPIVLRVCRENEIESVRIHRNIGEISLGKKIIKYLYNSLLKRTFKTTAYMGGADDIDLKESPRGIIEIMVHPDLDKNGNIIDRRESGGPLLSSIKYWEDSKRTSYSQL